MSPADIQFPVLLSLSEAVLGCTRDCYYPTATAACDSCRGTGIRQDKLLCEHCDGTGYGFFLNRIRATFPAGSDNQVRIKAEGRGLFDKAANQWGDLLLLCHTRLHPQFERCGFDLVTEVDLPPDSSALLAVPCPEGTVQITPPPTLAAGQELRVPGYGLPRTLGGTVRGDLIARFRNAVAATSDFPAAKQQAHAHANLRAWAMVLTTLEQRVFEAKHDAESLEMLGAASAHLGKAMSAEDYFTQALRKNPKSALIRCYLAMLYQNSDALSAALMFEAALRCDSTLTQARTALTQALTAFCDSISALPLPSSIQAIWQTAVVPDILARRYQKADEGLQTLLKLPEIFACLMEIQYVRAALSALAVAIGYDSAIPIAFGLFTMLTSQTASAPKALTGYIGFVKMLNNEGNLTAAMRLLSLQMEQERKPEAVQTLQALLKRISALASRSPGTERDPLVQQENRYVEGVLSYARSRLGRVPSAQDSHLAGLILLLHARYRMLYTRNAEEGRLLAAFAAQHLELALCLRPDDASVALPFQEAMDTFYGAAGVWFRDQSPEEEGFSRQTQDALTARVIPMSPLHSAKSKPEEKTLNALCRAACKAMIGCQSMPLRGEFLVAMQARHYLLTNYRLFLLTDRLATPQILPFNVINRYSVRAEGINISTVVIALPQGRHIALNRMPSGTFPDEALISHLLGIRMWMELPQDQQVILGGGHAPPVSPLGVIPSPAAPILALPAATVPTCTQCGTTTIAGDVFCRRCGSALKPTPIIEPRRV